MGLGSPLQFIMDIEKAQADLTRIANSLEQLVELLEAALANARLVNLPREEYGPHSK